MRFWFRRRLRHRCSFTEIDALVAEQMSEEIRTSASGISETGDGMLNLVVIFLFTCSWLLRHSNPTDVSSLATILAILALIVSFFSAWLGAELVYRLSIGVYPAAHENAENSLRE
jgi:uncharacterized membrane protein